jgi:hypothetical protein
MTYFRLKHVAVQLDRQTVLSNKDSCVKAEKDFTYSQDSSTRSLPGY